MDLRKPQPAGPSRQAPASPASIPMPTGFIDQKTLSTRDRELLDRMDWPESAPIPANIHAIQRAAVEEYNARIQELVQSGQQVAPPPVVDFRNLPPEHRQRIVDGVSQAKTLLQQQQQAAAASGPRPGAQMDPSVAETIRQIEENAARQAATAFQPPQQQPFVPPIAPPVTVPLSAVQPASVASQTPALTDSEPGTGATDSGTGATDPGNCPHCGWDLKRKEPAQPTDAQKREFLAHVLVPGRRYEEATSLLGGQLQVVFRSLTTNEIGTINRQIAEHLRRQIFNGDVEVLARMVDYRLILSMRSLVVQGLVRYEAPAIESVQHDRDEPTPLPALLDHVQSTVLASEAIRRAVGKAHNAFRQTYDRLTDSVADPNFFAGIEPLL
jgi:hypothetical protein